MSSLWSSSVDQRLSRIEGKQDKTLELFVEMRIEIAKLKIRAGFWGSAGATIVVLAWKLLGEA
jgi:hypothetical protein